VFEDPMNIINLLLVSQYWLALASGSDNLLPSEDPDASCVVVSAAHWGLFSTGVSWELTIDQRGVGTLILYPQAAREIRKTFKVSRRRLTALRQTLNDNCFFWLPRTIGDPVVDCDRRTIQVLKGGKQYTVGILFIHTKHKRQEERENARRAARIWSEIRGLIVDPDAFDSRPDERNLLQPERRR
jgi:hypothetical protein